MRRGTLIALAALAAPSLAGCVNDRPYPVASSAFYANLPPLPPPDYTAPTAPRAPVRRPLPRRVADRTRAELTDDQIRIRILQAAIAACGPGAPCLCPDVTPAMVTEWRRQHGA